MSKEHLATYLNDHLAGSLVAAEILDHLEVDDESNGQFRRLERLEALALGIVGKIALWQALNQAAELDAQLRGLDYEALARRGRDQHSRTQVFRLQAARLALPHGIK